MIIKGRKKKVNNEKLLYQRCFDKKRKSYFIYKCDILSVINVAWIINQKEFFIGFKYLSVYIFGILVNFYRALQAPEGKKKFFFVNIRAVKPNILVI